MSGFGTNAVIRKIETNNIDKNISTFVIAIVNIRLKNNNASKKIVLIINIISICLKKAKKIDN